MKFIKQTLWLLVIFNITSCSIEKDKDVLPFHSHNDYEQSHPFTTAFNARFKSIEADLYRVGDSLYVAHDLDEISKGKTLRSLYLEPLSKAYAEKQFLAYVKRPLFLLLDIKRESHKVYPLLDSILSEYQNILMVYNDGIVEKGVVQVIISGDRPTELMQKQKQRFAFIDGVIAQIDKNYTNDFIPLYSDNWATFFRWNGQGNLPKEEVKKIEKYASMVGDRKAYLRFWNTPNATKEQRENIYKVLSQFDNIIIGTDDIKEARGFLKK